MQGKSVTIKAVYKGNNHDTNLETFWNITTQDGDHHAVYPTDNNPNYNMTIDGCTPTDYCFTVAITIKSLTLDLSGASLRSMAGWFGSYSAGNSTLVVYTYPTLDEWLPTNPSNKCIEVCVGQSTKFACRYVASTDPNITITAWKFNAELLQHNSSRRTIITDYGTITADHVLSRLILSSVTTNDTGIYTCQCSYHLNNYKKGIVSNTTSFCLKVNATSTACKGQNKTL